MVMYTAKVTTQKDNAETGMSTAEVDVIKDGATVATMSVHDKTANIHERIKTDLAQVTKTLENTEATPTQTDFTIDDNHIVT